MAGARSVRAGSIAIAVAIVWGCGSDRALSPAAGPSIEFSSAVPDGRVCERLPGVTVMALDSRRLPVTKFTEEITVELVTGTGTPGAILSGTRTIRATSGVTTFEDLAITLAGSGYRLRARSGAALSPLSPPFNVASAVPSKLAFTASPPVVTVGGALPVVRVALNDACGSLSPGATNAVTMSFGTNAGAAALNGTTTVLAVGGVATFGDLFVTRPGAAYTLAATAAGLQSATSTAFTVAGPVVR